MNALLIHHKGAGRGAVSRKKLVAAIEALGWKVDALSRKKADADAIRAARPDVVAVAGGDGTVARIVKMLPDRSVPLAIVPSGTANNIARSLGICAEPEAAIAEWDMERRRRLDVGQAKGPWGCRRFVEAVGFGAFAESLRVVTEFEDEVDEEACPTGKQALRRALADGAPLPLEIVLDGTPLPGDLLMLEVMNVPLTGPRLRFAPKARPGDGLLHLSSVRAVKRKAMIGWLDKDEDAPPVEQRTGREIALKGGGIAMRIDDESCWLEPGSEVFIGLEGEPVQVLAPADAPALAGGDGDET
jgi:diacylglycerol kinase family enzyme